jgi:hypothetical protein
MPASTSPAISARLRPVLGSLKDYVNLSYDSEATIAREIGVHEEALTGWLSGRMPRLVMCLARRRTRMEEGEKAGRFV